MHFLGIITLHFFDKTPVLGTNHVRRTLKNIKFFDQKGHSIENSTQTKDYPDWVEFEPAKAIDSCAYFICDQQTC